MRFAPGALRQGRSYAAPPPPRLRLCQGRAARQQAHPKHRRAAVPRGRHRAVCGAGIVVRRLVHREGGRHLAVLVYESQGVRPRRQRVEVGRLQGGNGAALFDRVVGLVDRLAVQQQAGEPLRRAVGRDGQPVRAALGKGAVVAGEDPVMVPPEPKYPPPGKSYIQVARSSTAVSSASSTRCSASRLWRP